MLQDEALSKLTLRSLTEDLESTKIELTKKNQDALELNEEILLTKSSFEVDLEEVHDEAAAAKVEVISLQQRISDLKQNIENVQTSERSKTDTIRSLEDQVRLLDTQKEETRLSHEASSSDASSAAHDAQSTIVRHVMELGSLEAEVQELLAEVAAKNDAIFSHEAAEMDLAQVQFETQKSLLEQHSTIADLEAKVAALDNEVTDKDATLAKMGTLNEERAACIGDLEGQMQELETQLTSQQLEAQSQIDSHLVQLESMQRQLEETREIESGLKRENGLLRTERQESEEMRGRLSCELDSQRVALEELHNMKDSLTASNRQLDSDLCAASSKIQELHHLHKQKQQDKVCLAQPLLMQMVTYMNWFQETELATCMQQFDREKEFLKNELVEVLCTAPCYPMLSN